MSDVFERRFVNCHFLTHSLPKKLAAFKVWSCSELKANLTYFKACITAVGLLAQSAERGADNAEVVSSTLTRMTTICYFWVFVFCLLLLFSYTWFKSFWSCRLSHFLQQRPCELFGTRGCSDDKNWLDFASISFKISRFGSLILLSL